MRADSLAAISLLWPISGALAWLWIMVRNDMVDDFWDGLVAALQLPVAIIAGPLAWIVVLLSEYDGPIRK